MSWKANPHLGIVRTVINGLTFDGATTNPMEMAVRDAMIAFMAANVGNRIAVAVLPPRARERKRGSGRICIDRGPKD